MFGLILSEPDGDMALRQRAMRRLSELDLPPTAFTEEPSPEELAGLTGRAFLRAACDTLLRPGTPIPTARLLEELAGPDPKPANALRRCLELQLSLVPLLRTDDRVCDVPGGHLLGTQLLAARVTEDDRVDLPLPKGTWTDLQSLVPWQGRMTRLCSLMETPVLARENALIPVAVSGRAMPDDDADRVTLHWFQPREEAACVLGGGTAYHVRMRKDGAVTVVSNAVETWHLIVHRDGEETLIR